MMVLKKKKKTHHLLVESHEVKVLDPLVRILLHLARERRRSDHFSHILVHERLAAE